MPKEALIDGNVEKCRKELSDLMRRIKEIKTRHAYFYICIQRVNELSGKILMYGIEEGREDMTKP